MRGRSFFGLILAGVVGVVACGGKSAQPAPKSPSPTTSQSVATPGIDDDIPPPLPLDDLDDQTRAPKPSSRAPHG